MKMTARFLLLCDDVQRALLLDDEQRWLGEVIEKDGFIVDSLLRDAVACPVPDALTLARISPPPSQPLRCFQLH